MTVRAPFRHRAALLLAASLAALVWALHTELESSPLQWRLFTRLADNFAVAVEPGINPGARFPNQGPYDIRLGYTRIPELLQALEVRGYRIDSQARLSPSLESFIDRGGFPVYREKSQAGLHILDRSNLTLHRARHPERIFVDFEAIPPVVVATLLFIENRELLDFSFPTRNPAVEWDRLAAAVLRSLVVDVAPTGRRFGGSTLATQIEKFRHSPEGRTTSAGEKLRQVVSASARAYQDGADTRRARKRIVLDYLNSTPLAGRKGFGEVIGLGEGLHVWYGTDLDELEQHFGESPVTPADRKRAGRIYKQVLSLFLAQRRPSYYLIEGRRALADLTNRYLWLLAESGIISTALRNAALAQPLGFRNDVPVRASFSYAEQKALNSIRAHLLSLLRVEGMYDLDRLDMRVESTLDMAAQRNVTDALRLLKHRKVAQQVGLFGESLLHGDTSGVAYSVSLYESDRHANLVRVQADNLERPLDLNEGGRLDLGSTAKLRTLTTYLEIVAELHNRFASVSSAALRDGGGEADDPLTKWAKHYLASAEDRSLPAMLEAAMERRYSGAPATFFTGGGRHSFANSGKGYNRYLSVREGFRHSVNLVFIRMMRDIVEYYQFTGDAPLGAILADGAHPARAEYLKRFADREGIQYLNRFFERYGKLDPDEALTLLASRVGSAPYRLATAFRSVRPQASFDDYSVFMRRLEQAGTLSDQQLRDLYEKYGPNAFGLHDRGYLAGVHPLELWLVGFLQDHPRATRPEVLAASIDERQEVYQWLFQAKRKATADTRIRILAEEDAFRRVHASWRRQGYPFAALVPSMATAIGSSADRPAALAELLGIILNDGLRLPTVRIPRIHIAQDTPFETHLSLAARPGERVVPKEITDVLRRALEDVVAKGTARRLSGVYDDAGGNPLAIGGKTGTGDELVEHYGPGTAAGERKEVSRSAAFAFFLGDRHFGVVTAYVPGPNVKRHRFTSALPAQILKVLEPVLEPVLRGMPSMPIPGIDPMLIATGADNQAAQADSKNGAGQSTNKETSKRKSPQRSGSSGRTHKRDAPSLIDELF